MGTGLTRYLAKRLGFAVLMLIGVSLILFVIVRLAPGGPEAVLVGGELSSEVAAQVCHRLGLNRPFLVQYGTWAHAAARGELGRSFFPQQMYVTRQGYEGFVPIPTFGEMYQSMKSVRWTGT